MNSDNGDNGDNELGEFLRRRRKELGLSIDELAFRSHVSFAGLNASLRLPLHPSVRGRGGSSR